MPKRAKSLLHLSAGAISEFRGGRSSYAPPPHLLLTYCIGRCVSDKGDPEIVPWLCLFKQNGFTQ